MEPPSADPTPAEETAHAVTRRHHVLVIDDDPRVARALARMLRDHDVEIAIGGEAGLQRCLDGDHDVIVCDVMMPDRDGVEIHAALAARSPERARRMLFVTGGAFSSDTEQFLERNAERCLVKPVAPAALRAAIALVTELAASPPADSMRLAR